MDNEGQFCFSLPSGERIYLFTLRNERGTEVRITNYGAIITHFKIKLENGGFNDIVLGLDDVKDYLTPGYMKHCPYFGAAIGRYANRISEGRFAIDGKKFELTKNDGSFHLHGGPQGFHTRAWTPLEFSPGNSPVLVLNYVSPAGEEGYPGNLDTTLRFTLTPDDELLYEYVAATDAPTALNLTHHSYFNLDREKRTIGSQWLCIHSDAILEQKGYEITGNLSSVAGSIFDFRERRTIDKDWQPGEGFDHCFVLNRPDERGMFLAAEAWSSSADLKLEVRTTEPALQFYTGKFIPGVQGKGGVDYKPFMGFCLETQQFINSINMPQFPSTILRPGELYSHRTKYLILQG